jgi:hypothetical protein
MKSVSVKLGIDPQKYEATRQFMEEKNINMVKELSDAVEKFYKKHVPADVRKYIERSALVKAPPSHAHSISDSDTPSESPDSGA